MRLWYNALKDALPSLRGSIGDVWMRRSSVRSSSLYGLLEM
jgi:hypothetical protein